MDALQGESVNYSLLTLAIYHLLISNFFWLRNAQLNLTAVGTPCEAVDPSLLSVSYES